MGPFPLVPKLLHRKKKSNSGRYSSVKSLRVATSIVTGCKLFLILTIVLEERLDAAQQRQGEFNVFSRMHRKITRKYIRKKRVFLHNAISQTGLNFFFLGLRFVTKTLFLPSPGLIRPVIFSLHPQTGPNQTRGREKKQNKSCSKEKEKKNYYDG